MEIWKATNYQKKEKKEMLESLKNSEDLASLFSNDAILKILIERGIDTPEKVLSFINFKESDIPSIELMKDSLAVAEAIYSAIKNKLNIIVFADYDADGATSGSIIVNSIRHLGGKVNFFTSNRFIKDEGYGIKPASVKRMLDEYPETNFVITVDNGIVAFDGINELTKNGISSVIIDHHEMSDTKKVPECLGVVDPKQSDCNYPFKELCGAGLAYKVMKYMYYINDLDVEYVDSLLPLVAVGTVADVVLLKDENRYYVKKGLEMINRHEFLPLDYLIGQLQGSGFKKVDEEFIGFQIAPAINANGRLDGHALMALDLFTTYSEKKMKALAYELYSKNNKRKEMTKYQDKLAETLIEKECKADKEVIVLHHESFHEGLVGLIAGHIKEKYQKPVIIFAGDESLIKGSGRSIEGFDMKAIFDKIKHLLVSYGGHTMAAGVAIQRDNLSKVEAELCKIAKELNIETQDVTRIDAIIKPSEVSMELFEELNFIKPFGQGFIKPVFMVQNVSVDNVYRMGDEKQHIKYVDSSGLNIIDFNGAELYEDLNCPPYLHILGYPSVNIFNGNVSMQFLVNNHSIKVAK